MPASTQHDAFVVLKYFVLEYQVEFDKKILKFVRSLSVNVTWFLYLPINNFILLCTGPSGNYLQPYYIGADSNFNKLPRLECEYIRPYGRFDSHGIDGGTNFFPDFSGKS